VTIRKLKIPLQTKRKRTEVCRTQLLDVFFIPAQAHAVLCNEKMLIIVCLFQLFNLINTSVFIDK
jgi:hypothetical protein